MHIRIGLSFSEGRIRPSPSARVQSLCAYTDMHRGHRWGCHRQFKMDGLCEKTERLYTQTPEDRKTPNWGIGHLVTAYTRKHKQGQADTSWRHVRRCRQTRSLVCLHHRLCSPRKIAYGVFSIVFSIVNPNRYKRFGFK